MTILLAGDIGGTKTILRLVKSEPVHTLNPLPQQTTIHEQIYPSQDFPDLVPMVERFLQEVGDPPSIEKACFGIAGPVTHNTSELTNLSWSLSGDRLARELNINQVSLINDFAAIGYGVLGLQEEDIYTLQDEEVVHNAPIAVLGAGTGLGEAFLIPLGNWCYQVFSSEGAHGDFAPRSHLEFELLRYLLDKYNLERVSIERVVSGQGIVAIYQFLRDKYPEQESPKLAQIYQRWLQELGESEKNINLAAEISQAALAQADYLCEQTMKIFIEAYGAEAGNLALKLLPYGGLYVAGGIVTKILPLIQQGNFLKAFQSKGRMTGLMQKIPVHIVLNPKVGLIGATLSAAKL